MADSYFWKEFVSSNWDLLSNVVSDTVSIDGLRSFNSATLTVRSRHSCSVLRSSSQSAQHIVQWSLLLSFRIHLLQGHQFVPKDASLWLFETWTKFERIVGAALLDNHTDSIGLSQTKTLSRSRMAAERALWRASDAVWQEVLKADVIQSRTILDTLREFQIIRLASLERRKWFHRLMISAVLLRTFAFLRSNLSWSSCLWGTTSYSDRFSFFTCRQ